MNFGCVERKLINLRETICFGGNLLTELEAVSVLQLTAFFYCYVRKIKKKWRTLLWLCQLSLTCCQYADVFLPWDKRLTFSFVLQHDKLLQLSNIDARLAACKGSTYSNKFPSCLKRRKHQRIERWKKPLNDFTWLSFENYFQFWQKNSSSGMWKKYKSLTRGKIARCTSLHVSFSRSSEEMFLSRLEENVAFYYQLADDAAHLD